MARPKFIGGSKQPKPSSELEIRFVNLLRRIESVECTAACVETALLESKQEQQMEIAVCVETNIANELGRITRDAALIYAELFGEAYTPLLKSPILGLRTRPASQKVAHRSN